MITRRHIIAIAIAGSLAVPSVPGLAGPMQDFEKELQSAYADYRAALFRTNTSDKAASEAAIDHMAAKWQTLSGKWSSAPPPQYADDRNFPATLAKVAQILGDARRETASGKLSEAHETLEKIRDELGDLRRRNGVISFSDRMNAYHEQMEKILLGKYGDFDAKGIADLREDVAILSYLLKEIAANPPAQRDAVYEPALAAVEKSVETLRAALASGDVANVKASIKTLKPPYSRLFLNYG